MWLWRISSIRSLESVLPETVESKQALEWQNILKNLAKQRAVEFLWILGHSKIMGNEIGDDDLARAEVRHPNMSPKPAYLTHRSGNIYPTEED